MSRFHLCVLKYISDLWVYAINLQYKEWQIVVIYPYYVLIVIHIHWIVTNGFPVLFHRWHKNFTIASGDPRHRVYFILLPRRGGVVPTQIVRHQQSKQSVANTSEPPCFPPLAPTQSQSGVKPNLVESSTILYPNLAANQKLEQESVSRVLDQLTLENGGILANWYFETLQSGPEIPHRNGNGASKSGLAWCKTIQAQTAATKW